MSSDWRPWHTGQVSRQEEWSMLTREFCAENMELALAAVAAGASRIGLCDNLTVGGTKIAQVR